MERTDVVMINAWMRRIQNTCTTRQVLLTLNKVRCNFITCICLAIMVDNADVDRAKEINLVELFVVLTSAGGLVAVAWLGYASLYYYVVPALGLCFTMFLCSESHGGSDTTAFRDEAEFTGRILSRDKESLLNFYSLVRLRVEIPDIYTRISLVQKKMCCHYGSNDCLLTRNIVIHALYHMPWLDVCALLSPDCAMHFKCMVIDLKIPYTIDEMLGGKLSSTEYTTFRRLALILSLALGERYPTTLHSFRRKGWSHRITSVLT
jgi:hypothetical protein